MHEFASVQKGISFVYYGLYLIVGSLLALLLGGVLMFAASPAIGAVVMAVAPLMVIGGTMLGLVGKFMCLSVPDDVQATGIIYAAVVCDVIVLIISAASWIINLPRLVLSSSNLLSLAAAILFLVFLKKTAVFIKDDASERRAGNVLKLGVATFVAMVIGVFLPPLLIVAILMIIVCFFIYVRLLIGLKESLKVA